ncbi:MAG TPA: VWA domain-containing protein [Mycobacteriales bacterium]|nr:VWA domain-containing protein [Mycobacteriales bacterium]
MTGPDADLERWRLVLGSAAEGALGSGALGGSAARQDAALDWLYGRDPELGRRGERAAGSGPSPLTAVDWLDEIHELFPRAVVERLERDAVERYDIHEIVTDPAVLQRVEPNPGLLRAVLRTKHLMNPDVLVLARRLVAEVVRRLQEQLATQVRQSFSGARSRQRSRLARAAAFDAARTVRANLRHYQGEQRRLVVQTPCFLARQRREVDEWQVILVVDQSGSMVGSVIHSAVTAACLWGLPGVRAHLVVFDTEVVDLTSDVDDPVEVLMRTQLGGGTDIAKAMAYAADLVRTPRRTVVALVTDFFEGGDRGWLERTVRELVDQGSTVLGLAALDEDSAPAYDRELAQRLADLGMHVGAMTPGELVEFVAETVGR